METNSKIYLEYYNGKYCKFPDNISCVNTHGENFLLAGWVVYNKSTSKFLTFNKDMDPVHSGFMFNGEGGISSIKNLVILKPGSTMLESMQVSNEEEHEYITLSELQSSDIEFKAFFREKLWIKVTSDRLGEGVKIYNSDNSIIGSGEFTIKELDTPDINKVGHIWQGYFLGNKKVDGQTVFEEREAGSHIISTYKAKPILTIMWKEEKLRETAVDIGEVEIGRLPVKHGYDFGGVYDNPEFKGDPITSINITEDTTLYTKYNKEVYVSVYLDSMIDLIHGYEGTAAQSSIDCVKQELDMYNFEVEGFFCEKTYETPINDPFILPDHDMKIYAKCKPKNSIEVNVREFTPNHSNEEVVIPSHKITGSYDFETKSYIFRDVKWRVKDYGFIEFGAREKGVDYSKFYRAKKDGDGFYVSIPHKETYILELVPKYAKDLEWKIKNVVYNPITMIGSVMTSKEFDEMFVIPFSTEYGNRYRTPISMSKYDEGDFIEFDSELGLSGRVFSDMNCTTKVLSPTIDGNNVELMYFGYDNIELPVCYRKISKKPTMNLNIVDSGNGTVSPTSFIVTTDQTITLKRDMFTALKGNDGLVFSHFTYTKPGELKEKSIKLGDDLIMDRSLDMIAHWDKPIKATFMVDGKIYQEMISDDPREFTFTLPIMPYKPKHAFEGWDNTEEVAGKITIKEDTVFNAIFYPVDLL